jgi:dTDP-4-amino-4,6-dideoxygalactose transaminase
MGSEYKGIPTGSCRFSDMSVFSFHPLKNITTGEGGAVLTNSRRLYERLLSLRSHGIIKERRKMTRKDTPAWYYEVQEPGYNYRLSDIQSALGISQLGKLARFIEKRTELAAAYAKRLSAVEGIRLPVQRTFVKNSWNMYYIIMRSFAERESVFESMRRAGIQVQVRYIPLYSHPYYRKRLNVKAGFFPCSQRFYRRSLVLPMYPSLKIAEVDFICGSLREALKRFSKQGKYAEVDTKLEKNN